MHINTSAVATIGLSATGSRKARRMTSSSFRAITIGPVSNCSKDKDGRTSGRYQSSLHIEENRDTRYGSDTEQGQHCWQIIPLGPCHVPEGAGESSWL